MDTKIKKNPTKVLRLFFGEPLWFNVIGYDKETDQYSTQFEGKFGISWIKRSEVLQEIYE